MVYALLVKTSQQLRLLSIFGIAVYCCTLIFPVKIMIRLRKINRWTKKCNRMKKPSSMQNKKSIFFFLFFFLLLLIPIFSSFEAAQKIGNSIASDGNIERFTPEIFQIGQIGCAALGLLSIGFSVFAGFFPKKYKFFIQRQKQSLRSIPRRFVQDIRSFRQSMIASFQIEKSDLILLVLIMAAGFAVRWIMINRPMTHDESYSVYIWGSSSLRHTTNDYHLPNNHVFHSILVNLIYHTIGKIPAFVRLPAFISGWLIIPFAYLLGRKIYNRHTGLLTAGLAAFSPFLIEYSTLARGYSLLSLFTIFIFLLGIYVVRHKNLFAWSMMILISSIGFYTLPTMLYPFGALCVWLFLFLLFSQFSSDYRNPVNFLKYLVLSGLAVSCFSLLLYSPIFINSGTDVLFKNVFVLPLPKNDFYPTLLSRFTDHFHAFTDTVPKPIWILLFLGKLISIVFHHRISQIRIPLQAAFLLWLPPVILYQRPNLWPRTQIYLWVPVILWGSAGMIAAIDWIWNKARFHQQSRLTQWFIMVVTVAAAIPQGIHAFQVSKEISIHEIAIQEILTDDPAKILVAVAPEDDAALWYYADRYDLPKNIFNKNRPFSTVYVFANPQNEGFEEPRTIDDVLNRYGPGAAFVLSDTKQVFINRDNAIFSKFQANSRVVEETFGTK